MLIPDHETEVDFLNYEAIARTIASLLRDNRKRALTVGIHGDWGAGKSSVLKMVETSLSADNNVTCLWFNGWTFQGFEDAKTVLIEATITELCRQRSTVGKVTELGSKLLRRIDYFKLARRGAGLGFSLLTGLPSPDMVTQAWAGIRALSTKSATVSGEELQAGLDEAASFLKPAEGMNIPEQIHQFREDFRKMLEEAKIDQLVVLIDDLDRCLPNTAIETLEAIRLFLFVPKTAFVIGADEAMIEYAVRQHFPDLPLASGPMPYARNYLEKLIQVPFRIPALGIQETRTYVTLLLIESLVGDDHKGFRKLLEKARKSLNQPWLGAGISGQDVAQLDMPLRQELNASYVLAQRIGPILAEGTKGNPRQIKRFLNALAIRQAIADARGFGNAVDQAVLAKLMLAERFQPDFYEFLAARAMVGETGKVQELVELESSVSSTEETKTDTKKKDTKAIQAAVAETDSSKWFEREWLRRWLQIQPALSEMDLRPYVFVARDKRILAETATLSGLEGLIERLLGPSLAVRMAEPEIKILAPSDADQVFGALREKVLSSGNFTSEPAGFAGMSLVAKHHARFQQELIGLVGGIEPKLLGIWVVKGWNEVITEDAARNDLGVLMTQWANQTENLLLKTAAGPAVRTVRARGGH